MADYGLPDPILSSIQGGFAPDPTAPSGVSMAPPMDDGSLHPAILSGLFGMPAPQQIIDHEDNGGVTPTPQPPPPPPPPIDQGSNSKGPQKKMLGAAPIAPGLAGGPDAAPEIADTVPSVTGGQSPSALTNAVPAPAQPDYPVSVTMPTPAEERQRAAQDAAAKKQAAAQAAFAASPEGQSQRADQLKMQAVNQGQQAINDELAGTEAQNTAVSNALADSQKRQAQQAQIAAQKQAQDEAAKQKLTQQWGQQVQDAANYKVNDDRSVGLGGLIAIALSGIGDALDHRHGPNAAAQIIDAGIQKRIDDQYRQKQALYNKAGATKQMLDTATGQVVDDRTQQQLDLAAEHTRVADQIDSIKAQFANPIAKARAEQLSADQRVKAANIVQGAADRQVQNNRAAQEERDRQAQIGIGYANLAQHAKEIDQADQHFQAQLNQQRNEHADQMKLEAEKLAAMGDARKAAALQKQAEDLRNGGMMAPTGGTITIKNPDGTTTQQPAYDWMKQQDGQPWVVGKEAATELQPFKVRASVEKAISAIDALRKLRQDSGGDYTNLSKDANQKVAELQRATMALMGTFGGNASPRSAEILQQIQKQLTGTGDATSKLKAVEPILDQARGDIVDDLNKVYHSAGYNGKDVSYPDPLKQPGGTETQSDQEDKVLQATVPDQDASLYSSPMAHLEQLGNPQTRDTLIRANQAGVFPSQLKIIEQYGVASQSTDPSIAAPAVARLQEIVDNPKNTRPLRDAARQYLGAHLAQSLTPEATPQLPPPIADYIANRLPESK